MAAAQSGRIEIERVQDSFLDVIRTLLAEGKVTLCFSENRIGLEETEAGSDYVYLFTKAAYERYVQHLRQTGQEAPSAQTVWTRLREEGLIAKHDKNRNTKKKRFEKQNVPCICLKADDFYGKEEG